MAARVVNGRYELKEPPIGQGGMGVVYRVFDTVTKRYVALKTIEDHSGLSALELFDREWSILAKLSHPNIVEILDAGVYSNETGQRPYFVMPLLVGATLDQVLKSAARNQLPVERLVDVMVQVCRGLQAAHDGGLVHRDIKPSNIFITDSNVVKIIDFGVAHLADARSMSGIKGTLQYMAPEQMDMRPATPLSDIFSVGVVCYEALSGKRPFARNSESAIAAAIRSFMPPPLSEVNPDVNPLISRTIHKAIAKQPWHRFASAREFSDTLQKAFQNEPIERFDRSRIQPRIDRAQRAYDEGDYQFALDILNELESEGNVISSVTQLRDQASGAIQQKTVGELLRYARLRFQEEEFQLAIQKVQNAIELDPDNAEALKLKSEIEQTLQQRKLEDSFRMAEQYLEQRHFLQARRVVEGVLETNASNTHARNLLFKIDQAKRGYELTIEQEEKLYQAALLACDRGELVSAKGFVDELFALRRNAADGGSERASRFEELRLRIRANLQAEEQAELRIRGHISKGEYEQALAVCRQELAKGSSSPILQSLTLAAEEALRVQRANAVSAYVSRIEAEPVIETKYELLEEAAGKFPDEPYFQQGLALIRNRRDLMMNIIERARRCESDGHLEEAVSQWELLRGIGITYPGLDEELERLQEKRKRRSFEQARDQRVEQIKRYLYDGDYEQAQQLVKTSASDFPGDAKLKELGATAKRFAANRRESKPLLNEASEAFDRADYEAALKALRRVKDLAADAQALRVPLLSLVLEQARKLLQTDWRQAEPFVQLALEVDGNDPVVRSLSATLKESRRKAAVDEVIAEIASLQESGRMQEALTRVQRALVEYPNELRISQLLNALHTAPLDSVRPVPPSVPDREPRRFNLFGLRRKVPEPKPLPVMGKPSRNRLRTIAGPDVTSSDASEVRGPEAVAPQGAAVASAVQPTMGPGAPRTQPVASPQVEWLRRRWIAVVAGCALLVGGIAAAVHFSGRSNKPVVTPTPSAAAVALRFKSNVPGAKLTIDGAARDSWEATLSPGSHSIEASSDGYQPWQQPLMVSPDMPSKEITIALIPVRAILAVRSWLAQGKLVVDGGTPVDLKDGAAEADLSPGPHKVALVSEDHELLNFSAIFTTGQRIAIADLTKGTAALVVSHMGNSGVVYSNIPMKLESGGVIPAEGSPIQDLAQNGHQVVFSLNGEKSSVPVESTAGPAILVNLLDTAESGQNGRIVISANVPDAAVSVNGVLLKNPLKDGSRTVRLKPGTYKVQLTKNGYNDSDVQSVTLAKAETKPLAFNLKAIEVKSQLLVRALPADTQVFVDGALAGTASDSGTVQVTVTPGNHSVSLKKTGFENASVNTEFRPNETTSLSGDSMLIELGTLRVTGPLPANAQVTVHRDGDATSKTIPPDRVLSLRPGKYVATFTLGGRPPQQASIVVTAGKTAILNWVPSQPEVPKSLTPAQVMAKAVEEPSAWTTQSDGWWVHSGNGFGWLRNDGNPLLIDILKHNNKTLFGAKTKRIEFAVDFKDEGDQISYILDDHFLRRRIISHGQQGQEHKVPHGMDRDAFYRLSVTAAPDNVTIATPGGKVLDHLTQQDGADLSGKLAVRGDVTLVVNGAH